MGSRYLLSGAQLGSLIALCQIDPKEANKELNKIIGKQFVFESEVGLEKDIKYIQKNLHAEGRGIEYE